MVNNNVKIIKCLGSAWGGENTNQSNEVTLFTNQVGKDLKMGMPSTGYKALDILLHYCSDF
jgi:hypothetical protein